MIGQTELPDINGHRVASPDSLLDGEEFQSENEENNFLGRGGSSEFRCVKCRRDFRTERRLLDHLVEEHISLPNVLVLQLNQDTIKRYVSGLSQRKPPITLKLKKLDNSEEPSFKIISPVMKDNQLNKESTPNSVDNVEPVAEPNPNSDGVEPVAESPQTPTTDNVHFNREGWIEPTSSPKLQWLRKLIKIIQRSQDSEANNKDLLLPKKEDPDEDLAILQICQSESEPRVSNTFHCSPLNRPINTPEAKPQFQKLCSVTPVLSSVRVSRGKRQQPFPFIKGTSDDDDDTVQQISPSRRSYSPTRDETSSASPEYSSPSKISHKEITKTYTTVGVQTDEVVVLTQQELNANFVPTAHSSLGQTILLSSPANQPVNFQAQTSTQTGSSLALNPQYFYGMTPEHTPQWPYGYFLSSPAFRPQHVPILTPQYVAYNLPNYTLPQTQIVQPNVTTTPSWPTFQPTLSSQQYQNFQAQTPTQTGSSLVPDSQVSCCMTPEHSPQGRRGYILSSPARQPQQVPAGKGQPFFLPFPITPRPSETLTRRSSSDEDSIVSLLAPVSPTPSEVVRSQQIKVEAAEKGTTGASSEMRGDEENTSDSGVVSPLPLPPPSPTPSDILRPEGFLAPSSPDTSGRPMENGPLSPTMSCISTASTVAFQREVTGGPGKTSSEMASADGTDDDIDDDEMDDDDVDDEEADKRGEAGESGEAKPAKETPRMSDQNGWEPQQKEKSPPTMGNITVRPPAELLSPQGLINNSGGGQPAQDGTAEAFSALQGLVSDVQSSEGLKVLSPVDLGLLNGGNTTQSDATTNFPCDVCGDVSPSRQSLEIHKTTAGHYRCPVSADCPLFSSPIDVNSHYQAVHGGGGGGPVQQLTQQVQRLQSPAIPTPQLPPGVTLVAGRNPPSSYQQQQQQHSFRMQQPNEFFGSPTYSPYQFVQPGGAQVQQVVMTPSSGSSATPQLPNLPPGVQLSKRPATGSAGASSGAKQRRLSEDGSSGGSPSPPAAPPVRLPDSITLVRPNVSITQQKQKSTTNGTDANSVANMLATRGITVVPSSGRSNGAAVSVRRNSSPQAMATPTSFSSAVSITPQKGNFAVPSPGRTGPGSASLVKLPTVDLTQEMPQPLPPPLQTAPIVNSMSRRVPQPMVAPPPHSRGPAPGRPSNRSRVTCQVCDKIFASPEALTIHMHTHRQGAQQPPPQGGSPMRSASKLPYECNLCTAQYPTQQGLNSHKQKYHNEVSGDGLDVVIPVCDLRQPGTMQRLAGLGIRHFIPLAQLHNQGGGVFGLPIVTVDSARNPAVCNIGGIGASNLFPLGPMKSLR